MPGVNPDPNNWLVQQLAQMKRDIAALKAQRTMFWADATGRVQAIAGDISHDQQGNPTGLTGVGLAVWNGTTYVQVTS